MNLAGLKGETRLRQAFAAASRESVDVFMAQEHGLHGEDEDRLLKEADDFGYTVVASFLPEGESRGGTWVALRRNAFGLSRRDAIPRNQRTMGGRVTVVHVPRSGGGHLEYASVYVPSLAPLRRTFLQRLGAAKLLSRSTVVGADRNTVGDVSLDVRYQEGSKTKYPNAHAGLFDDMMAKLGLQDIFRQLEGKRARSYTRLGKTVHTRIDCIFGPKRSDHYQWYSYKVTDRFHGTTWHSDHLAVQIEIKRIESCDIAKGRPRVDPEIFTDPSALAILRNLYSEVKSCYPAEVYGWGPVMGKQLVSAQQVMAHLSAERKKDVSRVSIYFDEKLEESITKQFKQGPNAKLKAAHAALRKAAKSCKKKRSAPTAAQAHRRVVFEEMSTKQFHSKFRPRYEKRYIPELYHTDRKSGLPNTHTHPTADSKEMCTEAAVFYQTLMGPKPSDPDAARTCTDKLQESPLSTASKKKMEGKITSGEVGRAIRRLAKGKSCGPDGVPAEYFHALESMLADDLAAYYNELYEHGELTSNMLMGEIILLYKKKDPRDIRNYRPITLLNVEYKILTKILVERLKQVIEEIISPEQTGFVPGRHIQWNTHLLNLIEAYLNETDEEGLFIFLDWEKAFDRCSWPYLHKAARALGLSDNMCEWLRMLYDEDRPARRRVGVNGYFSEYFSLGSGTAQGCPASPCVFLLVVEALVRLIRDDPEWEPIVINGVEHRVSLFADDTVALVRTAGGIRPMWKNVRTYEKASGGLANGTKFEGLRLGRSRRNQYDHSFEPRITAPTYVLKGGCVRSHISVPEGYGIKWCKRGEYVLSLGVPHGWDFNVRDFFTSKYFATKTNMAGWHDVERMSPQGSAMVANNMVYSRFRYWIGTLCMPADISRAVYADVQSLIWGKDVVFRADELGSEDARRYIREGAQFRARRNGGIGLTHWTSHERGMAAIWLFRYNAAGAPPYKSVLDVWLARTTEGRGGVFSTLPIRELIRPLGQRACALPRFWIFAIRSLRKLNWLPVGPAAYINMDEARAEPFWTSKRIKVRQRARGDSWRDEMGFNRVQDLIDFEENQPHTDERIECELCANLETDGRYIISYAGTDLMGNTEYDRVPFKKMLDDWSSFIQDAGPALPCALGTTNPETQRYSTQAQSIMRAMGWEPGKGLGKHEDGRTSPIPTPPPPRGGGGRRGRRGGGRGGGGKKLSLVAHETSAGIVYGQPGDRDGAEVLEVWKVTPRGRAYRTDDTVRLVEEWGVRTSDLRPALMWDGGPVGVAETTYPHPQGWQLEGAQAGTTMEGMTVRVLTALYRREYECEPSCYTNWPKAVGQVDMQKVIERLASPLITPRDFKSYYRILNRSLYTRNFADCPDTSCRLCARTPERFSHLADCPKIREVFARFRDYLAKSVKGAQLDARLIYLGAYGSKVLTGSMSALHVITWKFVIIAFTRADTEGAAFKPAKVWRDTVRRFSVRLQAYVEGKRRGRMKREARGGALMPTSARDQMAALLHPCYTVDEHGHASRTPMFDALLLTVAREEQMERDAARAQRLRRARRKRARR